MPAAIGKLKCMFIAMPMAAIRSEETNEMIVALATQRRLFCCLLDQMKARASKPEQSSPTPANATARKA